ncbi:MAG TPA: YeeE/YedE thiosulfate transporter family protein [Vicinamibacterales bacterium]
MSAVLLPLAIGIAFGFTLERAGLGNARKLTGQFFLTDLTVFKVLFSAIVTAMLGLFWCSRMGWIDLNALPMPETYLRPQLAGGLIFGAGFALAGLCPGTSCVAAASGRGDGLAVVGGLFTGVLASGLSFPLFIAFYDSDARGAWTLPSLLHLPDGGVVLGIVGVAIVGFIAAERIERQPTAGARGSCSRTMTRVRAAVAAIALLVAAIAAVARTPGAPAHRANAAKAASTPYKPASGC